MLNRHDLLRVTPEGWAAVLDAAPNLNQIAAAPRRLVADWAMRGWPLIVRRPAAGEGGHAIAVGLPLPPSLGKLRLGFTIPLDRVAERLERVLLHAAMTTAPAELQPQLDAVAGLGARLSVAPAVFGALLWQQVTGLTYLRPGSDIDLLWPMPRGHALPDLLNGLAALDAAGPTRLDGEIILPTGEGVNWRELHGELRRPGGAVLVKSMDGAELRCTRTLFD